MAVRGWTVAAAAAAVTAMVLAAGPAGAGGAVAGPRSVRAGASATTSADWPGYLYDTGHSSTNAAAGTITAQNAGALSAAWHWVPPTVATRPPPALDASPTVVAGVVYIGSRTGWFYALRASTGQVIWSRDLGYVTTGCTVYGTSARGLTATAAVAPDPVTGRLVVYEAGADASGSAGNVTLYALDASSGAVLYATVVSTQKGAYAWGSPLLQGGRVYLGLSSACDQPLVRGALVALDAHSGAVLSTYWTVPAGVLGGGIWTTPTGDPATGQVWTTTGNGPSGDSDAMVRLSASLVREDGWAIPPTQQDQDYGASPVLFTAVINGSSTQLVGACDKNGYFYAFDRNDLARGPLWTLQAATVPGQCTAAAAWDAATGELVISSNATTVGGKTYAGAVRRVDPASGAVLWAAGLPEPVVGTPTLDGAGVLAVQTYAYSTSRGAAVHLFSADTGRQVGLIRVASAVFAQPVPADGYLFVATSTSGLWAYVPGSTGSAGPGAITVAPATVKAASTKNIFTFAYTSPPTTGAAHLNLTISVPAGWTPPQHTSYASPGFVRVIRTGCTRASISSVSGSGPWTISAAAYCPPSTGFSVSYGGGGTRVTAPTTPGSEPFPAAAKVAPGTTFVPLSPTPEIEVQ